MDSTDALSRCRERRLNNPIYKAACFRGDGMSKPGWSRDSVPRVPSTMVAELLSLINAWLIQSAMIE